MNTKDDGNPGKRLLGFFHISNLLPVVVKENKLIVKTFIREVILDNDSVTITYNFCEDYTKYKISPESILQVIRQSVKKTAYNKNLCSYKLSPLPPPHSKFEQKK